MNTGLRTGLFALVLLGAAGCEKAGPTAEITLRRTASRPSGAVLPGATARQRFEPAEMEAPEEGSDDLIAYDLPEGWKALAPTNERYVNLRPAGDPEASCYLSFLPGEGGGLVENVNRWRTQLGGAALGADEIEGLPTHALLGREGTLVEVEGTFTGMGGVAPRAGFKLLGLVVSEPGGSLFLKFTGPAPLVELERAPFLAFAGSLRLSEEHGVNDGHDHSQSGSEPEPQSSGGSGTLSWSAPPGWVEQAPRAMREVTFSIGDGAECYVARLLGNAGGLRMNLDRWSDQVCQEPLGDEAFAALETIEMLGQSVPVLELAGTFTGMDGAPRESQGLLALACIREHDSLFVKLTGPEALVHAERESFLAFARSLQEKP